MAWFKGTATDYHDFLDQLKNLVKDDHISAISVLNGGTDYAVDDTITLAGGTKYHEPELRVLEVSSGDYISNAVVNAGGSGYQVGDKLVPAAGTYSVNPEIEVTSVSGGAVTGVQINNPGICSSQPSNPVATTTDGSGTGCTLDLTFTAGTGIVTKVHISDSGVYTAQASNPVSQNTSSGSGTGAKFTVEYTDTAWVTKVDHASYEATSVAISAAGTGYTEDDIVTIVGGSFMAAATVKIDAVSAGVPTAVSLVTGGDYKTTPSNPASTSGGTGSGLTLTMTWANAADELKYLFIQNSNTDLNLGFRARKESAAEDAYYFEVVGFTGFNSEMTPWDQQPGFNNQYYNKVPLSGGASPATVYYWLSVSDRRLVGVFKVSSVYPNFYLGLIDPFLTASEYSHPMLALGCQTNPLPVTYGGAGFGGMNNPGAYNYSTRSDGPGILRLPDGSVESVCNWYDDGGSPKVDELHVGILPGWTIYLANPADENAWYVSGSGLGWRELFTEKLTITTSQDALRRINDEYILLPCTLMSEVLNRAYGTMTGVFAFNPDGDVIAEDTIKIGDDIYRVFQNCNKSNRNFFFALKEA